jgi:hypothetical protein
MALRRVLGLGLLSIALLSLGCSDDGSNAGGSGGEGGTAGSAGTGGSGGAAGEPGAPPRAGLWQGAVPAGNVDGEFSTGWAICFWVSDDGTVLEGSEGECDVDQEEDPVRNSVLEVVWKDDAGSDDEGRCNAGTVVPGPTTYPIRANGQFSIEYTDGGGGDWTILGQFNEAGDMATGSARRALDGMTCRLDDDWIAGPVIGPR